MCKLDIYKEGVDKLYKFISFGTDKELDQKKMETLKNKQLFASSPLFFNDPYDCELGFNFMDNFDEFLEMVVKVYQLNRADKRNLKKGNEKKELIKLQKELQGDWEDFRKEIAVCCFTETFDNLPMWSHYANDYKGICLEYDINELHSYMVSAINYTDNLVNAMENLTPEEFEKDLPLSMLVAAVKSVYSKQSQWSYEREWRIVLSADSEEERYIDMPVPKSIYTGFRLDSEIEKEIIATAREWNITVKKASISPDRYKLTFTDL